MYLLERSQELRKSLELCRDGTRLLLRLLQLRRQRLIALGMERLVWSWYECSSTVPFRILICPLQLRHQRLVSLVMERLIWSWCGVPLQFPSTSSPPAPSSAGSQTASSCAGGWDFEP